MRKDTLPGAASLIIAVVFTAATCLPVSLHKTARQKTRQNHALAAVRPAEDRRHVINNGSAAGKLPYAGKLDEMFHRLLDEYSEKHPQMETAAIEESYRLAKKLYGTERFPKSKQYVAAHALQVAFAAAKYGAGETAICAAILHKIPELELRKMLKTNRGRQKSGLVSLTKAQAEDVLLLKGRLIRLSQLPFSKRIFGRYTPTNYMNMIISMAKSPDALLLLFADKIGSIDTAAEDEKAYLEDEIAIIYAPLAERLGLEELAAELLDKYMRSAMPEKYADCMLGISRACGIVGKQDDEKLSVSDRLSLAEKYYRQAEMALGRIKRGLEEAAAENVISGVTFYARVKSPYSAFRKQTKKLTDALGIKAVVKDQEDTGRASGIIMSHLGKITTGMESHWHGLDNRRSYRAHHITATLKGGGLIEIQILTNQEFATEKSGAAAHWKRNMAMQMRSRGAGVEPAFDGAAEELTGGFRQDFAAISASLSGYIYPFTFIGEGELFVARLPSGSVPADFAASPQINALGGEYRGMVNVHIRKAIEQDAFFVAGRPVSLSETYRMESGDCIGFKAKGPCILTDPLKCHEILSCAQTEGARKILRARMADLLPEAQPQNPKRGPNKTKQSA